MFANHNQSKFGKMNICIIIDFETETGIRSGPGRLEEETNRRISTSIGRKYNLNPRRMKIDNQLTTKISFSNYLVQI